MGARTISVVSFKRFPIKKSQGAGPMQYAGKKTVRSMRALLLVGGCACVLPSAAFAQSEAPKAQASGGIETVVVTAQKRAENVQTVPLSVTPITGAAMEKLHVQDFKD